MSVYLQGGKKYFKELPIISTLTKDFSLKGSVFSKGKTDTNIRKPTFTFVLSNSYGHSIFTF